MHPSQTAAVLQRFGFRFSRDRGQNFLVDPNVLVKIVSAAELTSNNVVLEIGAGIGTLTEALASAAAQVIAVEIDRRLAPILAYTLAGIDNVTVLRADAMDLDLSEVTAAGRAPDRMVSNLPYGIAAPVLLKIFSELPSVTRMVALVQREIADRIMAKPGTKTYSAFTVKLRYFAGADFIAPVSKHVFMPPPNVDSAIIRLSRWERPPIDIDRARLFGVVTAGFSQRRKQLVNTLVSSGLASKDAAEQAMADAGLERRARAEDLSLTDFAVLTKLLEGGGRSA